MEQIKLINSGTIVDLQISTPTSSKRVRSEFIGSEDGQYIIIKYPDTKKWGMLSDFLFDGAKMVVRCILENETAEVVAFRTEVLAITGHPVKLLFLHYPKSIESLSLRAQPRLKVLISSALTVGEEKVKGMVLDISLDGALFVAETLNSEAVKKGENCQLSLSSKEQEMANFNGEICNINQGNGFHHVGIKFSENEDTAMNLFDKLLIDPDLLNGNN